MSAANSGSSPRAPLQRGRPWTTVPDTRVRAAHVDLGVLYPGDVIVIEPVVARLPPIELSCEWQEASIE